MLELETVVDIGAVEGFPEVFLRVDKVHHAKIDIIRVETGKEIPDERIAELHVAGAQILPVLHHRTDMTLKDYLFPLPAQRVAQMRAHFRLRHKYIHDVDAALHCRAQHRLRGCIIHICHVFASEADAANLKTRFSQRSVFHCSFPLSGFIPYGFSFIIEKKEIIVNDFGKVYAVCRKISLFTQGK